MPTDPLNCEHLKTTIPNIAKYADYINGRTRLKKGFEFCEKHNITPVALRNRRCKDCSSIIPTIEISKEDFIKLVNETTKTKNAFEENISLRKEIEILKKNNEVLVEDRELMDKFMSEFKKNCPDFEKISQKIKSNCKLPSNNFKKITDNLQFKYNTTVRG